LIDPDSLKGNSRLFQNPAKLQSIQKSIKIAMINSFRKIHLFDQIFQAQQSLAKTSNSSAVVLLTDILQHQVPKVQPNEKLVERGSIELCCQITLLKLFVDFWCPMIQKEK
jgi:hypothetical protein